MKLPSKAQQAAADRGDKAREMTSKPTLDEILQTLHTDIMDLVGDELATYVREKQIKELKLLLPQMGIEEYSLWVRGEIVDRLRRLKAQK